MITSRRLCTASRSPLGQLLRWSDIQGEILSGGGRAEQFYTGARGFPFRRKELPHYHLDRGTTHEAFASFIRRQRLGPRWAVGAWERPLFFGGWRAATRDYVCNAVSRSYFVDFRSPLARDAALSEARASSRGAGAAAPTGLGDCSDLELRVLARQHAFAGYGAWDGEVCARHHCIDWNWAPGCVAPRSRPNKWRAEPEWASTAAEADAPPPLAWKEWSHATDDFGQSYYVELWRRTSRAKTWIRAVALRSAGDRDAVVVVAGDRFAYAVARPPSAPFEPLAEPRANLARAVDAALEAGRRRDATALLALEAGAGDVSTWTVDRALHPWDEGRRLVDVLPALGAPRVDVQGDEVALGEARFHVAERPEEDDALRARLPPEAVMIG